MIASVPATEHVVLPQRSVHDCEAAETCHPGVGGGELVGDTDGVYVAPVVVGDFDGVALGDCVGVALGSAVGEVGVVVGALLGASVGE